MVATGDAIRDAPLAIQLLDVSYVVWRGTDGLFAALDRCTHREARLSRGSLDAAGCLQCPYHGWTFASDGQCVSVPSSGRDATIAPAAHLAPVAVTERYGLVWLCPGEPAQSVPHLGVEDDPAFTRLNTPTQIWGAAATRMIDNMLDVAHFPYTHAGTFGLEQEAQVPHFSLKQLDDTFHGYEYSVTINNEGEAQTMSGDTDADVIGLDMSTGFALPFSVRSTMSYETGIEQTLFMTAAPISAERSYFTFVLWRNDDVSVIGQDIVDFELAVAKEDQAMLENLSGELSLDRGALVDVQSDKASLEWRRRYRALVLGDEG